MCCDKLSPLPPALRASGRSMLTQSALTGGHFRFPDGCFAKALAGLKRSLRSFEVNDKLIRLFKN